MNRNEFILRFLCSPVVCMLILVVCLASVSGAVPWTVATNQITRLEQQVADLQQVQASNTASIARIYGEDAGKIVSHGIAVGVKHTGQDIAHPFVVAWNKTTYGCAAGLTKVKSWFHKNPGVATTVATAIVPKQ